jgi:hypothetical protein
MNKTYLWRTLQFLASRIYRKPIVWFDALNYNALLFDWIRSNSRVPKASSRKEVFQHVFREYVGYEPIDYLEFGVYRGESLRLVCDLNKNQRSRFFGFDTFSGLPEDWWPNLPKGAVNAGGLPQIDDSRVKLVRGLFQETLIPFLDSFRSNNRLIVYIDADLFSSTLFVLSTIDKILSQGDVLILDDFANPVQVFRAFFTFSKYLSFKHTFKPIYIYSEYGVPTLVAFKLE